MDMQEVVSVQYLVTLLVVFGVDSRQP